VETFLTHAGYGALILFAFVEACCIPISSEITFGFAGVLVSQGHLNLALVIIIGTLAELAGSSLAYGLGRVGGRPVVERLGKYVLITSADIDRAERFFDGRGAWAVAVGRMLPLVRAFIGLGAGVMEVPATPFGLFNLLGTAIWATVLSLIGYEIGQSWTSVAHGFSLAGYAIAALFVLSVAALIAHRIHAVRKASAHQPGHAAADRDPSAGKSPAGPAA
jgi:membrane protein DedA with SNARE-associated domain